MSSEASSRRLELDVEHVSLGWFAVDLEGARVRPLGAQHIGALFPHVRIELSPLLSPSEIIVKGGEIRLEGSPSEIESDLDQWRAPSAELRTPNAGRKTPVDAEHLDLRWAPRQGEPPRLEIHGLRIARSHDGWTASFASAIARDGDALLEVVGAQVAADPHGVLIAASATSASIGLARTGSGSAQTTAARTSVVEASPPPLPQLTGRNQPKAPPVVATIRLPLPDLHRLHSQLFALGALAANRSVDGAHVDIDSLAFSLGEGDRRVAVGRGPLHAIRSARTIDIDFVSGVGASGTPLSMKAALPLSAGDAVVSMSGGPISLARLGVDEGAAGIVAVDRTTVSGQGRVALAAAGDTLTFEGNLSARGLTIDEPRIARETVRGLDVTALARGVLDDQGGLRLDDAEAALGSLRAIVHGNARQETDHLVASLLVDLPSAPCQSLLQSMPSALVPTLDGAEMAGSFGMRGRVAFDSQNLDDLVFDWDTDNRCTLTTVPEELAKERFAQPFEHPVYEPDGSIAQETTGPTSDNWTDLEHISPFMQVAVLTTEDGAFFRHHGFNRAAMRNALVADLKAGRFARGASTITMQLAKNLFLSRDKTLSRKLEEVVLADYLESAFTKEEMIELYLNVIEFGPGVYGITHAAAFYFGRRPAELDLAECLFLSSILPSPIRYSKLAEKPRLSDSWTKHLHDLMAIAAKLGTISDSELAEGLKEDVAFHAPEDPPLPARPLVTGTHFQATHEKVRSDWEETPDSSP